MRRESEGPEKTEERSDKGERGRGRGKRAGKGDDLRVNLKRRYRTRGPGRSQQAGRGTQLTGAEMDFTGLNNNPVVFDTSANVRKGLPLDEEDNEIMDEVLPRPHVQRY